MSPFSLISTRHIYKNPWISVREDAVVRPDGQSGIFGVVTVQDGAHIVAIDTDDYIYLGREYCYGMRAYTYRLPGGGISVGETPLDAAKKELREEAGIVADTWIPIGSIYPLTTVTENIQYLYIAKWLVHTDTEREPGEVIDTLRVHISEAYTMVCDGRIVDASAVAGILRAYVREATCH